MFTDAVSARTKAHQRTDAHWASNRHNIAKPNVVGSAFLGFIFSPILNGKQNKINFKMKSIVLILMMCVSLFANAQEKQVDNLKKTDEVLSEIVKKALTVAEKTGDFVIEQTPMLLQEFYRWHIAKSSLSIFISLLSVIFMLVLMNKHIKYVVKEELDMSDVECFFPRVFGWIGFFVAVSFFIVYVYDLAFILFAPKLYLIEYFVK